jgi:hypothetical protein
MIQKKVLLSIALTVFMCSAAFAVIWDFEPPAYTTPAALDSQEGWTADASWSVTTTGPLSGTSSAEKPGGVEKYSANSTSSVTFSNSTVLSMLYKLHPGTADGTSRVILKDIYGDPFVYVWLRGNGENIYLLNAAGDGWINSGIQVSFSEVAKLTVEMDFTTSQCRIIIDNMTTPAKSGTSGWTSFANGWTLSAADANGTFEFSTQGGIMDNVTVSAPAVNNDILLKPISSQVIQREGFIPEDAHANNPSGPALGYANVTVEGVFPEVTGETFEYRVVPLTDAFGQGCDWTSLSVTRAGSDWSGSALVSAGGWYRIEVRNRLGAQILNTASAEPVGVGEVFVISGQSYAGYSGDEPMLVEDPQERIVLYDVSMDRWTVANEPIEAGGGGTIWVPMANILLPKLRVPIGLVLTGGWGDPSRLWLPGEDHYDQLLAAGQAMGTFRAVLWQQGESDVMENTSTATYVSNLTTIRSSLASSWGFEPVWLPAKSTRHTIYVFPVREQAIRDAISQLWITPGFGQGPDTDLLGGENRGGEGTRWHFTGIGQRNAGAMWFAVLWHELQF